MNAGREPKVDKKQVTSEWQALFPSLTRLKPMWLVRRHGPILYGLCLDSGPRPEVYIPKVFMHCLADPFPVISLNGAAPMPTKVGQASEVSPAREPHAHERIGAYFAQRHPALGSTRLSLGDVIRHFQMYLNGEFGSVIPFQHGPYLAMALAAAAIGETAVCERVIGQASAAMSSWPDRALTIIGNRDRWVAALRDKASRSTALSDVVASEVAKHGLENIPDFGLLATDVDL